MKKRKRVFSAICFAIVGGIFLLLIIPFRIQKTLSGIEIDLSNPSKSIQRTITLDGYYYFNVLKQSEFAGKLLISGYPITQQEMLFPIEIKKEIGENEIIYQSEKNAHVFYGILLSDLTMKEMVLILSDLDENDNGGISVNTSSGRYIVVGTTNYQEAIIIVQECIERINNTN